MDASPQVRVRFAPSPTGHLHIGGARTAIYNWAFARRHEGSFILRIDDTDPERSTDENTEAILRSLRWLGLDWDEGPDAGGDHGPYFQTLRSASYLRALERLIAVGAAYPCFCTAERLEANREAARAKGGFAGYDRSCRFCDPDESKKRVEAGEQHVWRMKVPEDRGDVVFEDAIRGRLSFPSDSLDDFVLMRSDGTPTYNFASVADDVAMGITHVLRGDDHLSNTPRQILVLEGLGESIPTFAHLSMILGPDGKRLSKRHGATSVEAYRDEGYMPEALVNYLALLGWSLDDKTTVFSAQDLVENFALDRVSCNPAVFDSDKLEWMNGVYIRELPACDFADRMTPLLVDAGLLTPKEASERRAWLESLAPLVSERVKRFGEVVPMVAFLFTTAESLEIDEAARQKVLAKETAAQALRSALETFEGIPNEDFGHARIEAALRELPDKTGIKPKDVFQPVRVAVSGSSVSPPLFESLELLGKDESAKRVRRALESLPSAGAE